MTFSASFAKEFYFVFLGRLSPFKIVSSHKEKGLLLKE